MKRSVFETLIGAAVICTAVYFFCFIYKTAEVRTKSRGNSYEVVAKFSRIDGINAGSEVRIGGIKIGEVRSIELDTESFKAVALIDIKSKIKIPVDSSIQVLSDGLLGGKFLNIEPGAEQSLLLAGEELKYTQSSISIENLIGKYIFGGDRKN